MADSALGTQLWGPVYNSSLESLKRHWPSTELSLIDAAKTVTLAVIGTLENTLSFNQLLNSKTVSMKKDASMNTLPWPAPGDYAGEQLVKTLSTSRQQAIAERNYAVTKATKLQEEIYRLNAELATQKHQTKDLDATMKSLSPYVRQSASGLPRFALPVIIIPSAGSESQAPQPNGEPLARPVKASSTMQTQTEEASLDGPPDATDLNQQLSGQKLVISSLEREVERLRQERDATHQQKQQELDKLVRELEETKESFDQSSSAWDDKMKELNRLRTILRFSQLKADSDKLQGAYKKMDELENTLRKYQMASQRADRDRSEFRRLRMLDAHCKALIDRGGSLQEIPPHLLQVTPAALTPPFSLAAAAQLQASSPASPSAAHHDVPLPNGLPIPAKATTSEKAKQTEEVSAPASVQPRPGSAGQESSSGIVEAEEDTDFSTIVSRMQAYQQKKALAAAQKAAAEKKELASVNAGLKSRPTSASSTRPASAHHAGPTIRPSSARALQLKPSGQKTKPIADVSSNAAPARSYSFIGGRLVPFYKGF
jgi:hypothetical protein